MLVEDVGVSARAITAQLGSRRRLELVLRALCFTVFILLGTLGIAASVWQLQGDNPYSTDLKADYLRSLALRDGVDIFSPIDTLADRYFPIRGGAYVQPSPHPPVLALVTLPLTLVSFPVACGAWLVLNLALLFVVGRWLHLSPAASVALAAWPPIFLTLKWFQWELILLALLLLSWRSAARWQDRQAGLWLGLAAMLKFYPAFLILPFLVQRRFRLVGVAVLTVALGQLGNLAVVGPQGLWRYYSELLPHLGVAAYAGIPLDTSVRGELLRLLAGSPGLVLLLTAIVSLAALVALARLRPEAGITAVLILLPTYVLSIYVTIALPQIVSLWRSGRFRVLVIAATVAASFPYYIVDGLIHLPSLPALFGAIEPVGYIALLACSLLVGSRVAPKSLGTD